jgi:hypothetical protein
MASALANLIDDTRRLVPDASLLFSIRLLKPGIATADTIARITKVISNSIKVKPVVFFKMRCPAGKPKTIKAEGPVTCTGQAINGRSWGVNGNVT